MNKDFVRQAKDPFGNNEKNANWWNFLHVDPPLMISVCVLCCFGLFVLFSASGSDIDIVRRQAFTMFLGLVVMFLVAQLPPSFFRRWAPSIYFSGLGLLIVVLIIGVETNGAKSWLDLPGLPSFQPSELMKFVVPMSVAWHLGTRPIPPKFRHVFWSCMIIVLPALLVVLQNDMGTALMIVMSGVFVILLAGIQWKLVFSAIFAVIFASPVWYLFVALPHQKSRILTFFDPYRDPTGAGYNIIQSQIAIGSGGVYGKGYGNGAQSHLDFIPESNTDFIMAVLAEEFGLLGVAMLIFLYLSVLIRAGYISLRARDSFGRLLAGSVSLVFFLYIFVNMAMVSGLLPVIGLPLPLISRGGTSVVTLFVGFGLLMSVHTHSKTVVI
jgi:rod shape determining protein RodA